MSTPEGFDDLDLRDLDDLEAGLEGNDSPAPTRRAEVPGEARETTSSRPTPRPNPSSPGSRPQRDSRSGGDSRTGDSRSDASPLAPRASTSPRASAQPASYRDPSRGYAAARPDPRSGQGSGQDRQTYASGGYTRSYADGSTGAGGGFSGGGFGGSGGSGGGSKRNKLSSNLTILALVALISFFAGFASRNTYDSVGGFDDERLVTAQEIPLQFRSFCISYNGYPSFTLVQLTSISTLTVATVPILRLDTCTIPVDQTANALQALGIQRRADTIGPQLGGSNLTLISMPVTTQIAESIFNQLPQLSQGQRPEEEVVGAIQQAIDTALGSNLSGLELQGFSSTNITGVYVMVPGHSFNLRPSQPGTGRGG